MGETRIRRVEIDCFVAGVYFGNFLRGEGVNFVLMYDFDLRGGNVGYFGLEYFDGLCVLENVMFCFGNDVFGMLEYLEGNRRSLGVLGCAIFGFWGNVAYAFFKD